MKKLLFLLLAVLIFGCSTEENEEERRQETPETFSVKYEILGHGEIPQISYSSNEGGVVVDHDEDEPYYDASGVRMPFVKEIQYTTKLDGEVQPNGTTIYGCDNISISAYANRNHGYIEAMNIYINGVLKDSRTSGNYYMPGETWPLWGSASFTYLRRGADPNDYGCD
jgi:hypothetical protein